jgi:hypothetical protein
MPKTSSSGASKNGSASVVGPRSGKLRHNENGCAGWRRDRDARAQVKAAFFSDIFVRILTIPPKPRTRERS